MRMFNRNYIATELGRIDEVLDGGLKLYILGGGCMSFENLKDATKDIDVVVKTLSECKALVKSLKQYGYRELIVKETAYKLMGIDAVLENDDGFRWDIFVQRVCRGLLLSKNMIKRSKEILSLHNINAYTVSLEDVFIFKSVTSRERDREDMYTLFRYGLDFDVIRDEIIEQSKSSAKKAWLAFFFVGLEELKDRYDVVIPYFDEFYELACGEVLKYALITLLKEPKSIEELHKKTGEEKEVIQNMINELISEGKIAREGDKFRLIT